MMSAPRTREFAYMVKNPKFVKFHIELMVRHLRNAVLVKEKKCQVTAQ